MDTKTLNTYFHNKVLILNIALTFVIVMLHSKPLNRIEINNEGDYALIHAVVVLRKLEFLCSFSFLQCCFTKVFQRCRR